MLDTTATQDEVSEFGVEELLFSRTDSRGVIQSANEAFRCASKYERDQVLGAPHEIVRHPDMPAAVFWIIWDKIKRGEPVGAYLKNKAADGSYYWVFAVVTPVEGGYLSVCLKPTAGLVTKIDEVYGALRERELRDDVSAEETAASLTEHLRAMGWASYRAFMTNALAEETAARDAALSPGDRMSAKGILSVRSNALESVRIAQTMLNSLSAISGFPVNMQIQASKLKTGGALFGSIAENYQRLCMRLEERMSDLIAARQSMASSLDDGLFRLLAARYQHEMLTAFQNETSAAGAFEDEAITDQAGPVDRSIDQTAEIERLRALRDHHVATVDKELNGVATENDTFERFIDEMLGFVSGLGVTQFVGLVETARLNEEGQTLNAMLREVTNVQNSATDSLKSLQSLNRTIGDGIRSLAARV